MRRPAGFLLICLAMLAAPAPAAEPDLASRLMPLIRAHNGKVAVAVKHLETGETFLHQADEVMPTASLIKLAIMAEAYRQAEEGKLDLDKMLTLTKADKVQGSGILTQHFSDGSTLALRDAVRLMITFSDNTATNLVLDQIGLNATNEMTAALGAPETRINAKVFRPETRISQERGQKYGLGTTTAGEMLGLCERLARKELVSPEASEAMLGHLRTCDDADKFPRFLPQGTRIAFKTGSVDAAKTAAGIVEDPAAGPFAICVLTADNADRRWVPDNAGNRLCAEIARECFDHFRIRAASGGRKAATTASP